MYTYHIISCTYKAHMLLKKYAIFITVLSFLQGNIIAYTHIFTITDTKQHQIFENIMYKH
jgi:hypothetical protein